MRKPVNNETNLINEIWSNSNKQLNERRDSVAEPTVTDIMGTRPEYDFDGEKQKEAQKKYQNTFGANWAELTADALKKQKIKNIQDKPVTSQEMGPEVDIEDDNDTDGVVVVDMRPAFTGKPEKSTPEMPRWSESPHGYEPVTPEQAEKTAQEMESQNKFIGKTMYPFGDVQKRAATKVGPPVPTQAERNQQAKDATQKLVDTATKILNPQIKKEVTKISQQEQPMDTAVEKYKKQLADRVSPSVVKTSEIESMFNLTPQSPGDMGPRLNIPMGKPVEAKAEKVEAGIEKTISRANKLAAEEKAATPEERAKVVAGAERLSKETGKEITPYTVAHEKATRESLKTNLEKLNQLEKSNQQKLIQQQQSLQQTPKPQSKPTSRTPDGGPGSGRDTSNIVPGSQMWGELSSSERQKIRDRYSKGEGPSISIRYNEKTGKFDEPGYGDQGQYGDIVKALNMNESVNLYSRFISEMAKRNPKTNPTPIIPGIPATNKLKQNKPAETTPAPAPTKPAKRSKSKSAETIPAPAPTKPAEPTPTPVTPTVSKPTKPAKKDKSVVQEPDLFSGVTETPVSEPSPKIEPKETKTEPGSVLTPVTPVGTTVPVTRVVPPAESPVSNAAGSSTTPLTPGLVKAPNWTWGSGVVSPQTKPAEPPMMSRTKAAGLGVAAGAAATGLLATIMAITSKGAPPQALPSSPQSKQQVSQPTPLNTEDTPKINSKPTEPKRLFNL